MKEHLRENWYKGSELEVGKTYTVVATWEGRPIPNGTTWHIVSKDEAGRPYGAEDNYRPNHPGVPLSEATFFRLADVQMSRELPTPDDGGADDYTFEVDAINESLQRAIEQRMQRQFPWIRIEVKSVKLRTADWGADDTAFEDQRILSEASGEKSLIDTVRPVIEVKSGGKTETPAGGHVFRPRPQAPSSQYHPGARQANAERPTMAEKIAKNSRYGRMGGGHSFEDSKTKDGNPKDAVGIAKWRQYTTVPMTVMSEVGVAMLEGGIKYGRHNYRVAGVRASVYVDAAWGHLVQWWEGEDIDKDSGLSHITKAITSLVVLRDAMIQDMLTDDRPPKAKLDRVRDNLGGIVKALFKRYPKPLPPYVEK